MYSFLGAVKTKKCSREASGKNSQQAPKSARPKKRNHLEQYINLRTVWNACPFQRRFLEGPGREASQQLSGCVWSFVAVALRSMLC
eukprot:6481566-Amphidinium_carterae.2